MSNILRRKRINMNEIYKILEEYLLSLNCNVLLCYEYLRELNNNTFQELIDRLTAIDEKEK